MYKFRLTAPSGETEIVEGDWPNQRDAKRYAIISSVMRNTGTREEEIAVELLEPLALARPPA